jgi:serine/threonine protein kinase
MAADADLGVGTHINGEWMINGALGSGTCGKVFRARSTAHPDQQVAIKFLVGGDRTDQLRFLRERFLMEHMNKRGSPHVVRLIDIGLYGSIPYIVMELCHASLDRHLDRVGSFDESEACWIVAMAVTGLRAANTIHRDLKPGNLLISNPTSSASVCFRAGDPHASIIKVADFGLAKDHDPQAKLLTTPDRVMGTPAYMSPEQWRDSHDVGVESDIYALGVILYQMVTGHLPFDHDDVIQIGVMHQREPLVVPSSVSPAVAEVLRTCMAKDPHDRYRTLATLEQVLRAIAGIAPVTTSEPEPAAPAASAPPATASGRFQLGAGIRRLFSR